VQETILDGATVYYIDGVETSEDEWTEYLKLHPHAKPNIILNLSENEPPEIPK
jgi:hypothetical protein